MKIEENYPLDGHNTFHLKVSARWFIEYGNTDELVCILRDEYFRELPSLHIGAGSNLLFTGDYNGAILHSTVRGIEVIEDAGGSVVLRIGAGETWDDVVAFATKRGWGGIENLSFIPGETGAAAVQNIGAYGSEISDVIESVEVFDIQTSQKKIFTNAECGYGYRRSIFKETGSYIVTHITIRLSRQPVCHIDYGDLRQRFADGASATPAAVREAVISIRRSKLPDPARTGNAGSFFINPVVSPDEFERLKSAFPDLPSYPASDGIKIPAGWLIDRCGLKGVRHGDVGVYPQQALVIVNYGQATGSEIALFAAYVAEQVYLRFKIRLTPEVKYIG